MSLLIYEFYVLKIKKNVIKNGLTYVIFNIN